MRSLQTAARGIIGVAAALLAVIVAVPATGADAQGGVAAISPERAAALAVNELEAVEGGYELRSPTLRASFSAGGVELRPRGSDVHWGWRLSRLEPGGDARVQSIAPANPEAGLVRYQRGTLNEEYGLEADGIAQRFVLHAPPPLGGGDLVLEGVVSCDGEFSAARGGWEWRGGRGVVWLGPVTVVDADGTVLPATFEVTAGTTRLVVEGAALAGAAYPLAVELDLKSHELRISDMGGTGDPVYDASKPAVAFNSTNNQYLVVWSGDETGGGLADDELEIFGQRLNAATGAELGANDFRISDMGGTGSSIYRAYASEVAYNSTDNQYLVVWQGDENYGGMVAGEYEIFGQRLDATGAELGANDFRISDMGGTGDDEYDAELPAVAYNSTNNEFLVVWDGDDSTGGLVDEEYEIFVQRLDAATGAPLGYNDLRISDMGGTGDWRYGASSPEVAYNNMDNRYLVGWSGDDNIGGLVRAELEIFGELMDAATLTQLGDNDFRISDMGGTGDPDYDASKPAVSYNSTDNEFLAVWNGDDDVAGLVDEEREIFGQRLDAATGAELGANDFRISDMGGTGDPDYGAWDPRVAYNSTNHEYLVVWRGNDNVGGLHFLESEIFAQRLDAATGAELGTNDFRISEMGGTGDPEYTAVYTSVASNSGNNQYLVVWQGDDNIGGLVDDEFEIFGKLLGILPFEDGFESGDTSAWSTTAP